MREQGREGKGRRGMKRGREERERIIDEGR